MNERIQTLADEIWTDEYWTNPNTDKLLPAQLNKFAELIVRECAKVAVDCDVIEYSDFRQGIAQEIKQHFGVEK